MLYIYGTRWSGNKRGMLKSLTEDEARQRFDGLVEQPHHWFSVAAMRDGAGPHAAPEFVLEVLPHAEFIGVQFLDQHHSKRFSYGFRKSDSRMFMESVVEHRYADDTSFHRMNESRLVEEMVIRPDGYVKQFVNDYTTNETHISEYRGVDVSGNWEKVPVFGDWEGFGRFER